jgi:diguanylate cyclase (GGDEF)-like protein
VGGVRLPIPLLPMTSNEAGADIDAALRTIWSRHRDGVLEQVTLLERAAVALERDELGESLGGEARAAAHRLAGSLGTFGLRTASERARRAEQLLEGVVEPGGRPGAALAQLVAAVRCEVEETVDLADDAPQPPPVAVFDPTLPLLLIVEDDAVLAERLAAEAERSALRATCAADPEGARAALARERPDAVVLDLMFAGSAEAAHELLSELSAMTPPVPVLVSTVRDELAERVAVARRGARGFVTKSLAPAEVIEQAAQLIARSQAGEVKLLAVDDDPTVLESVHVLLSIEGFHVSILQDPTRFWEELERVRPDLVLLDVEMPEVSGIELCRVLRNDPTWAAVPVMVLTSRRDAVAIEEIFAAGADDYLAKPVLPAELRVRVHNRVERLQLHRLLSEVDGLTGVANRSTATHSLDRLLHLALRNEQPLSLAIVDLDRFKDVNDRHGHPAGDEVLRRFGRVLRQAFRGEDVVGRWGGEEFAIGMYGMSAQGAAVRLEQLLAVFGDERFAGAAGHAFRVGFSAGVASFPDDGDDLSALHAAADRALYRAKDAGRGCVRLAHDVGA